jgi:hypothetical protein
MKRGPVTMPSARPLSERFWEKVNKDGPILDGMQTRCWIWTAASKCKFGYGAIGFKRSSLLAHRVSWQLERGNVPDEQCVLHKCDNPKCVNPDHLFLGTYEDNRLDAKAKGRHRWPVFSGENSPTHKLTWETVREIRRRCSGGERQISVALSLGLTRQRVSAIARGDQWVENPSGR